MVFYFKNEKCNKDERRMKKIGIITYHAAYNYGSVLQAYATQIAVNSLGYDSEIINYRMKEQRKIYKLYRTQYGIKTFLKDLMQLPVQAERKQRIRKFETFINSKMKIGVECIDPSEVEKTWSDYNLVVSGSDQIWNKHSLEMENNNIDYMYPYLLKGFNGKKVSYASSIANMTDHELGMIISEIGRFDAVSMRESTSAERVSAVLGKKISTVVDPTFLLNKEEWIAKMGIGNTKDRDSYILYYSLGGIKPLKENTALLRKIGILNGLKVKVITPFAYVNLNDEVIEMHPEVGPEEFLELIYNAKMVVTNSYHGTILSVNLNKDVYSLCEKAGSEFRKTDILKRIGLEDRIVYDVNSLENSFKEIDYEYVNSRLEVLRNDSLTFLKDALNIGNVE